MGGGVGAIGKRHGGRARAGGIMVEVGGIGGTEPVAAFRYPLCHQPAARAAKGLRRRDAVRRQPAPHILEPEIEIDIAERVLRRARRHLIDSDRSGFRIAHARSEEHTSELQSLMRTSYAVFSLQKKPTSHVKKQFY